MRRLLLKTDAMTIVLLFVLLLAGCAGENVKEVGENPNEPIVLTTEQEAMVESGNAFAFDLLSSVNKEQSGSFVISPLSLQFILGMLLNGASDDVADEICQVLGYGAGETASVNEYCGRLIRELPSRDKLTQVTTTRVALSCMQSPFLQSYQDAIGSTYGAMCESVDFLKYPATARQRVNTWCSQNTNGMIPEFFSKEETEALRYIKAIILDASWFKGNWTIPFDEKDTKKGSFYKEDGTTRQVKYMKMRGEVTVKGEEGYTALRLYYGNRAFSMVFVLPDEGKSVTDVLTHLSASDILDGYSYKMTDIRIPRFETETTVDYQKTLESLGMKKAFEDTFPNMFGDNAQTLNMIKQKTALRVDESGAEAASVTAAIFGSGAPFHPVDKDIIFHADHPFLFFIEENSTGAILFAGCYRGM